MVAASVVTGLVSGAHAQNSAGNTGTANVTLVPNDGNTIVVRHSPIFGLSGSDFAKYSGSAAKIPANLSGIPASKLALGEPEYEVNVCISLTSEMVSRDGLGDKLRGDVYLEQPRQGSSNRTSAQQNGSEGNMSFLVSAMAPDASGMSNGNFDGAVDVEIRYN